MLRYIAIIAASISNNDSLSFKSSSCIFRGTKKGEQKYHLGFTVSGGSNDVISGRENSFEIHFTEIHSNSPPPFF
jgi:hypothetical protein